jgi:sulfite reductase (NADPH) flavoprotein alpha-component
MEKITQIVFNKNQEQQVESLLQELNPNQLSWLAGYLTGVSQTKPQTVIQPQVQVQSPQTTIVEEKLDIPATAPNEEQTHNVQSNELTVLYGSRTGNGESVAKSLKVQAEAKGLKVALKDMNDYQGSRLKDEKNLVVIVSTHGEGEPPIAAEDFYGFVHGKKAPKLEGVKYSVLALGDKSYVHFCKVGKDIDDQLQKLGAERVHERVDCDVDFTTDSGIWIHGVLSKFDAKQSNGHSVSVKTNGAAVETKPQFNKQNPFKANILEKVKLNGRGSAKETFHYELSLENSGLTYEPGDSLGVYGVNSEGSVNALIDLLKLNPAEEVKVGDKQHSVREALTRDFEISTLSPEAVTNYNKLAQSSYLTSLLTEPQELKSYIYGRDIIDLIREYPVQLNAKELTGVLRKLHPRLYSISSSLKAHPDEVHLTIAAVRYNNGRYKEGVCSTFLADRVSDDDYVKVYVEKNPEFRLPSNPDAPIIMVGPGTGIAPFRAFIEERNAVGAKGKNWLFFGDRNFTTDFLYQSELLNYKKKGLLTKLSVAFSRDSDKKVYVQHKMLEQSRELFNWLEEGGYFYVCGDMQHMWKDVNKTLIDIVAKEASYSIEKAEEYVQQLRKQRRYLTDVY